MPHEFALDLCFIREHSQLPLQAFIDRQLRDLFSGRGSWYIDCREEDGLDIAVAEVKGLGTWESADELLRYIEHSLEQDDRAEAGCWDHLQGYQVKVFEKMDAGCCQVKVR